MFYITYHISLLILIVFSIYSILPHTASFISLFIPLHVICYIVTLLHCYIVTCYIAFMLKLLHHHEFTATAKHSTAAHT